MRRWGAALDTANMENVIMMENKYPELNTPVTLESVFTLRDTGQEDKERWPDTYELSV